MSILTRWERLRCWAGWHASPIESVGRWMSIQLISPLSAFAEHGPVTVEGETRTINGRCSRCDRRLYTIEQERYL